MQKRRSGVCGRNTAAAGVDVNSDRALCGARRSERQCRHDLDQDTCIQFCSRQARSRPDMVLSVELPLLHGALAYGRIDRNLPTPTLWVGLDRFGPRVALYDYRGGCYSAVYAADG